MTGQFGQEIVSGGRYVLEGAIVSAIGSIQDPNA